MKLYGKNWTRRELEARFGSVENTIGIKRYQLSEGPEAGVQMAQIRTGNGLTYHVNLSRALDIELTEFCGTPISWHSVNGNIHPAYYDDEGLEWLRTATGGLLMTCGLTQVGSPCTDQGESLGLHGRAHHLPARRIATEGYWENDDYFVRVSGVIQETKIFSENIRLIREVKSKAGENRIIIQDTVENLGFSTMPHMILYHFNFGFPLMDKDTKIVFPSKKVIPREDDLPIEGFDLWQDPEVGYQERVYYHTDLEKKCGGSEMACVEITSPRFPIHGGSGFAPVTVRIKWDTSLLDRLIQWKMPAAGVYVLGIEPANCYVAGRAAERERGTLQMIEPGEKRRYHLEIEIF